MKINEINKRIEDLCAHFGVPIEITTVNDPAAPRQNTAVREGVHCITLNIAKIPAAEYPAFAGYHARQVLLPRLVLETDRLILRRYRPEDAADCFAFLSSESDAYMDCSRAFTAMDQAFYERVALFADRETQYMILRKDSGRVIGTINLFPDDSRAVDAMEIGYCISPAHQRQGFAFEALAALLDLLQGELYLDLVTAGILPENTASQGLLKKLGFCQEGLRHKAVWHEMLDRPVDLIYYRDREM